MKIYTRTGDKGTTALFGGGRVSKSHPRIEAYGTVDEANSVIGLARAHLSHAAVRAHEYLDVIQADLFTLGADLATPADSRARTVRLEEEHVERLERWIDELEMELAPLKHFILPGGSPAGAVLHVARTTCRRAERLAVKAAEDDDISPITFTYLNRLSDFLFVLARWVNAQEGVEETKWSGRT